MRRLRIRGQHEYINGRMLVLEAARRFTLSMPDADDFVSYVFQFEELTEDIVHARKALHQWEVEPLANTYFTKHAYTSWRLSNYFDNIEWRPLDKDLEHLYLELRNYMSSAIDDDTFASAAERLSQAHNRIAMELDRLRNLALNTGKAEDRQPIEVLHDLEGLREPILYIIESMKEFTEGIDTPDRPNFAVRMPGETEVLLRRMKQGDALLLASFAAVQDSDTVNLWEPLAHRLMFFLGMGKIPTPPANQWLPLIIDYCATSLRAREAVNHLLRSGVSPYIKGLNSDYATLVDVYSNIPSEEVYRVVTYLLVIALNWASQRSVFPSASLINYMDERGHYLRGSPYYPVRWVDSDENQTTQNNSRPDINSLG